MTGSVYWVTGLSGSGKTTIGTALYYRLKRNIEKCVLLDGDVIKKIFGADTVDYSPQGRKKRAYQYAELCKLLSDQGITVVCCTIAMYDEVRRWNRQHMRDYIEIYIEVDVATLIARDVKGLYKKYHRGDQWMVGINGNCELPKTPDVVIHNTMDNQIDLYVRQILSTENNRMHHQDTMADYWNNYYKSERAVETPSDFAVFACRYMDKGKKLIDLGCGNGRDSIFFHQKGLRVTSVDQSHEAIRVINKSEPAIFAVCDDFIRAKALFCVDYHYCYARWTLHAIHAAEQEELFCNVYNALHAEGLFFIEARTVNDYKHGEGVPLGVDEYFNDGHYRRFLRVAQLEKALRDSGFDIRYIAESNAFSVMEGDQPTLVRVVAQAKNKTS